jgi:Xaa-Pro aminopeptidase
MNFLLKSFGGVFYECSYANDNCIYLNIGGEGFFITDFRYDTEAYKNVKDAHIVIAKDVIKETKNILLKKRVKKMFFDPLELNCYEKEEIEKIVKLYPKLNFSKKKRAVKQEWEIKLIKKSALINKEAFKKFCNFLKFEGEEKEESFLHYKAKEILSNFGKYQLAFEPIVAIEENSSCAHASPSQKILKKGELILFDAGIKYKGYCSDRTRVGFFKEDFSFDDNQKSFPKEIQKIFDIVYDANRKAIEKIKCGIKASKIDKIARESIYKAGYGKYFTHSTGHGVGIDIHEFPVISP